MLKIGDLTLSSPYILSPLAGISDLPFRMLNRSFGCEFAFTEMVSARALVGQRKKSQHKLLSTTPADRPLGVQLLGNDAETLRGALDRLRKYNFDIIDFNAACPVIKVTRRGEGASLLKEPRRLGELLRVVVAHADIPVTVKIRSGWDDTSINARDVALYAQDAGVKGLVIHGRTKAQGYQGTVDYQIIRAVKEALSIPVIASGDALSPRLIKKLFDETGCDGVAIARGALGNPWIFKETGAFIRDGIDSQRPGMDAIADTMISHLNLCIDFHGERMGTMIFRKFFAWYTKGIHGVRELKCSAFRAETKDQMIDFINEVRTTSWDRGFYCSAAVDERINAGRDLIDL